jgi:hypothetical protein
LILFMPILGLLLYVSGLVVQIVRQVAGLAPAHEAATA